MKRFKDFLNEELEVDVIEVDSASVSNNKDALNAELDALTDKPYQNAPIFLAQLRGCLERYGMQLPAQVTPNFLNLSAELVYGLGDTDLNLYVVFDTNEEDGFVDGYAQVVDSDELSDLMNMEKEDILGDREELNMRPSTWYAKRDDDSGNTDEYA